MIVHKVDYSYYFIQAALISQRICAFYYHKAKQGSLEIIHLFTLSSLVATFVDCC